MTHLTPDTLRYEGASTFYGPNTLQGHIQELSRLAKDIATGAETTTGPPPQINPEQELNLIPPPKLDKCPWWHTVIHKGSPTSCFGNVLPGHDAKRTQHFGTQLQVKFRGANPRHNLRLGGTYMTLERVLSSDGGVDETEVVMTDSDYSTNFEYKREFGTNFVDGLNFCRKKEEGCNMAAIGKAAGRIIESAENVITHKITQGDISNNLFMSIVNISHAIKATDDLSTNDVLCLGGLCMCVSQGGGTDMCTDGDACIGGWPSFPPPSCARELSYSTHAIVVLVNVCVCVLNL